MNTIKLLKQYLFFVFLLIVLTGCSDNEPEPYLNVIAENEIWFSPLASDSETKKVFVDTNQEDWNVSCDQDWCIITKQENGFLVGAKKNYSSELERQAFISVESMNAEPVFILVTQNCVEFNANVDDEYFVHEDGGKIKININSNFEWNIESDKDWVNFSKTHGYNNDSVFITINPATDTIITNANIKITSSNLSCDFNIIRDYIHPVYNIGDCYPNTTSPIGVVFDVSEDGKKGKIVAICKENLYSRYSTWYEYVGANEYLDGEDNMKKVIENSSLYEYPAMRYCSKYKDGSWYLPAYLEINIMNARRDVVNAKLKELNAEIINGYYISSTEHGLTQFMTGGYESGTYQIRYLDKKVSMKFVPIRKF